MIIKAADWTRPNLNHQTQSMVDIGAKVRKMLQKIETEGDSAIERFSEQFDQMLPKSIELMPFDDYQLETDLADSIQLAAQRIEEFCRFQKQQLKSASFNDKYGDYGQIITPIERIGAYIPAGRFPLISTALMTLIPAKVAGSTARIACSPSTNTALLAAASLAGATEFLQLGGVQAIAAMAYGYQQRKAVDLIVGPGNVWVNEAKKQLQGKVKIDGQAGPSELLAICDGKQPMKWLALDALAQAEHDPLACSLITSDDASWLARLAEHLKRNEQFTELLQNQQIQLIEAESTEQLIAFSDAFAPEHLMLCHANIQQQDVKHFGSLFIGANSAVALGDYITGPNHTLPTMGFARQTGGLSVNTFLRIQTVQTVSEKGRRFLSNSAMAIAKAEGLEGHYQSLKIRTR